MQRTLYKKSGGTNPVPPDDTELKSPCPCYRTASATAAGRPATGASGQAGCQFEPGTPVGLDEIHIDRFNFFQKTLIDKKSNAPVRKDLIISL